MKRLAILVSLIVVFWCVDACAQGPWETEPNNTHETADPMLNMMSGYDADTREWPRYADDNFVMPSSAGQTYTATLSYNVVSPIPWRETRHLAFSVHVLRGNQWYTVAGKDIRLCDLNRYGLIVLNWQSEDTEINPFYLGVTYYTLDWYYPPTGSGVTYFILVTTPPPPPPPESFFLFLPLAIK